MNYQLLPDLAAMATLLVILYFLRRRHPQESVNLWMTGLLFIFLEAIAHVFYAPNGRLHVPSHLIALDAYLAAGVIFLWAAAKPIFQRIPTLVYLGINTMPLLAVITAYGLDVRKPFPYEAFIAGGLLFGVATPFALSRRFRLGSAWWLVAVQVCMWGAMWFYASRGLYRDSVYTGLFVLYLATAVVFQLSLPAKSLGKVAIVLGFTLWALVFLTHSWVTSRPQYIPIASEIWDMQKFLVTIGMLLVMLEQQVSSNEWYALHDQLTGLPNRRLFEERLTQAVQHSKLYDTRVALLMLDLNGFKLINDSLGHDAGDELLRRISVNLRNAIRTSDTVARLGGDEFIIIATDLPSDQAVEVVVELSHNRISQALKKAVNIAGSALTVTGSVGVAIYPDDTTDEVLLRRLADQRMYQQKRQITLDF
jgi:diguanylate cyclase (GGDEF)-like protein